MSDKGEHIYIPDHRRDIMPSQRWVRAQFGGQTVASSTNTMLARETGHWRREYYFPQSDVQMQMLVLSDENGSSPTYGVLRQWHLRVGDKVANNAAWSYPAPPADAEAIKDRIAFDWDTIDAWFEESEQVYVHARDPYSRIDVLNSSRHIRVEVDGVVVADTRRARLLFETGLPTRYYIPKEDVRMEFLAPSEHSSQCPYKGVASYYSVVVNGKTHPDIVWYYPFPIPECPKIENLLCFYNEVVDIWLDGEREIRPKTHFI